MCGQACPGTVQALVQVLAGHGMPSFQTGGERIRDEGESASKKGDSRGQSMRKGRGSGEEEGGGALLEAAGRGPSGGTRSPLCCTKRTAAPAEAKAPGEGSLERPPGGSGFDRILRALGHIARGISPLQCGNLRPRRFPKRNLRPRRFPQRDL